MEAFDLLGLEITRAALRVNPRAKQRLIRVNIAQTSNASLIEQHTLDRPGPPGKQLLESLDGKIGIKRLNAKAVAQAFKPCPVQQEHPAELALIGEAQVKPAIELECQVLKSLGRLGSLPEHQPSSHAEMHRDRHIAAQVEQQEFTTASNPRDLLAGDRSRHFLYDRATKDAVKLPNAKTGDGSSDNGRLERPANCLDFWQFWHTGRDTSWTRCARVDGSTRTVETMEMPDHKGESDCVFCKIVRGDFGTDFVAESESAVAFRDIHPQAPTHVLVVPRRHVASLNDLDADDWQLAAELLRLAVEVARREGISESGYRVLTNTGPDAGQTVFHLHFHVLGGRPLRPGLA